LNLFRRDQRLKGGASTGGEGEVPYLKKLIKGKEGPGKGPGKERSIIRGERKTPLTEPLTQKAPPKIRGGGDYLSGFRRKNAFQRREKDALCRKVRGVSL